MGIWNHSEDENNDIARLLQLALPHVDTDAEMLAMDTEQLRKVEQMAESFLDPFLAQTAALADLLSNADPATLCDKHTLRNAGCALATLTSLQEIMRRIASLAGAYSDPETRELYLAIQRRDVAEVARLTQ